MQSRSGWTKPALGLLVLALALEPSRAGTGQKPAKSFAYVGPNLVITAEVAGAHSFVVNFINLSDFVIVVQPNDLIYKGASGRFYIGQVYEAEHKDSRGEIYKYSASRREFWKLRPNNIVIWNAIQWGCENGFHTFDFGRTEPGNEGLRSFKQGWGTAEMTLSYSTLYGCPPNQARSRAAEILRWPIQKMPTWFCRLVGELAYRHAA